MRSNTELVYITPFGTLKEKDVPAPLWEKAMSFIPRSDGQPDMRYKASREAVQAHAKLDDIAVGRV